MDKTPKNPVASSTEDRLLDALRTAGPFTLDTLSLLFDMSWGQAFLVVDRLSRSRHVALHRTDSREYLVSISTGYSATRTALRPERAHE